MNSDFALLASEWSDGAKSKINEWMRSKLTEIQGESPEDMFLEYISIMIGNGKKMSEIEIELKEFMSEAEAKIFAEGLAKELTSYSKRALAPSASTVVTNSKTTKKLQSVAQKIPSEQVVKQANLVKQVATQNTRLLTSAIKSSSQISNPNTTTSIAFNSDNKKRKSIDSTEQTIANGELDAYNKDSKRRIVRTVQPSASDVSVIMPTLQMQQQPPMPPGFDPQAYMEQMKNMTMIIAQQQEMLNVMSAQQQFGHVLPYMGGPGPMGPPYGHMGHPHANQHKPGYFHKNNFNNYPVGVAVKDPTATGVMSAAGLPKSKKFKTTAANNDVVPENKFTSIIQTEALPKSKKFSKSATDTSTAISAGTSSVNELSKDNTQPAAITATTVIDNTNGLVSDPNVNYNYNSNYNTIRGGRGGYHGGGRVGGRFATNSSAPHWISGRGRGRGRNPHHAHFLASNISANYTADATSTAASMLSPSSTITPSHNNVLVNTVPNIDTTTTTTGFPTLDTSGSFHSARGGGRGGRFVTRGRGGGRFSLNSTGARSPRSMITNKKWVREAEVPVATSSNSNAPNTAHVVSAGNTSSSEFIPNASTLAS